MLWAMTTPTTKTPRELREAAGLRVIDLASRAGIAASTVQSWEATGSANLRTIELISAVLGVPVHEVVDASLAQRKATGEDE